jgi:L-methionine (R)-S-oxide reductase
MKPCQKSLQELGGFVLAGAHGPAQLKKMAEIIREARDYRWAGIYKMTRTEFIIVAGTGTCPPAYPRFPITQGLCGAAAESGQTIIVGDVHKDPRYLPTFGSTQSEIIVPIMNDTNRLLGMLDVESAKLNAFEDEDRQFLERAASLLARALPGSG